MAASSHEDQFDPSSNRRLDDLNSHRHGKVPQHLVAGHWDRRTGVPRGLQCGRTRALKVLSAQTATAATLLVADRLSRAKTGLRRSALVGDRRRSLKLANEDFRDLATGLHLHSVIGGPWCDSQRNQDRRTTAPRDDRLALSTHERQSHSQCLSRKADLGATSEPQLARTCRYFGAILTFVRNTFSGSNFALSSRSRA